MSVTIEYPMMVNTKTKIQGKAYSKYITTNRHIYDPV